MCVALRIVFAFVCLGVCALGHSEIPQELKIETLLKPSNCNARSRPGDLVRIHYTGTLEDGTQFDTSYGKEPTIFKLGGNQVVRAWEDGLQGMCVGEKRKLIAPPRFAYGSKGFGDVPPKSVVIFEIELIAMETAPTPSDAFLKFDINGDGYLEITEVQTALNEVANKLKIPGLSSISETMRNSMVQMIFIQADKDRDSQLSMEEFNKIPGIEGYMRKHDEL